MGVVIAAAIAAHRAVDERVQRGLAPVVRIRVAVGKTLFTLERGADAALTRRTGTGFAAGSAVVQGIERGLAAVFRLAIAAIVPDVALYDHAGALDAGGNRVGHLARLVGLLLVRFPIAVVVRAVAKFGAYLRTRPVFVVRVGDALLPAVLALAPAIHDGVFLSRFDIRHARIRDRTVVDRAVSGACLGRASAVFPSRLEGSVHQLGIVYAASRYRGCQGRQDRHGRQGRQNRSRRHGLRWGRPIAIRKHRGLSMGLAYCETHP